MAYSGETYDAKYKFRVVLEALKSDKTDTSVANAHDVHPVTLSRWKNHFLETGHRAFLSEQPGDQVDRLKELKEELEERETEIESLSEIADEALDTDQKVEFVDEHKMSIGLNRSCELVGLAKSTYYYRTRTRDD